MARGTTRGQGIVLETDRLLLRRWRVSEAGVRRDLWMERDPRVPPHRRISAEGRPTVQDLEESIRNEKGASIGLLAVERRTDGAVIGYCGLLDGGGGGVEGPDLAFELLRAVWGQGYATEAASAVLGWAASSGYERVNATVWDWNTASRRVLAKLGFVETSRSDPHPEHGTTLLLTKRLQPPDQEDDWSFSPSPRPL